MTWPFGNLRMFGYQVLLIDPPWAFENWSEKGEGRNASQHYETMTWEQIAALPVGHLASDNCACFLWCVDPLLDRGFDVLRAWGFAMPPWPSPGRSGRGATRAGTWGRDITPGQTPKPARHHWPDGAKERRRPPTAGRTAARAQPQT
jgi:hypothetical protein